MKVNYNLSKLSVEFDGETVRDVWKQIAVFQEVFGESACGKCGSENLRFIVRENEGNEYYELRCTDCNAKLQFGANKQGGGLFPRRKDADGNWIDNSGWQKWNPTTKSLE